MDTCVCPTCGAKMVEYRFRFNRGLAVVLVALYRMDKPVAVDSLGLTYSQRTNSQKLRYWGLAVPVDRTGAARGLEGEALRDELEAEDARRIRAGWWCITQKGKEFVEGLRTIPAYSHTRRGAVTGFSGDDIHIWDVPGGYEFRGHYAEQARACKGAWDRFQKGLA